MDRSKAIERERLERIALACEQVIRERRVEPVRGAFPTFIKSLMEKCPHLEYERDEADAYLPF